jgi:hypothetical protein
MYRIRLFVVNPIVVGSLGTAFDSQTDSVKKYIIRLFVVNPSAVRIGSRWTMTMTMTMTI